MDHQWRPRAVQGSVCPVCYVPHYPFCPPPPPFGANPNFPPPSGHQRPGFDPLQPRPWRGPGTDGNWRGYPDLGIDPYGQFPPIRPHSESLAPVAHPGGTNGFVGEAEKNYKRMRVDGRGSFGEDERRLKLIRDHGNSGYGGLEVDRLANDASSSGAELATGDKEMSRFSGAVSGRNTGFVSREDGFSVKTQSSLQSTDLSPSSVSWSGMRPPSYEHWSGMLRDNFGPGYMPPHPYRMPFSGNNIPGMTQYAAPSLRPHSPSPPSMPSPLFPVPVNSSAESPSYPSAHDTNPVQSYHHYNRQLPNAPTRFIHEEYGAARGNLPVQYTGNHHPVPSQQPSSQMPKVIDASRIFMPPHRATRPDHFVVILRGLPGSGKSYLAKMLRDLEVENGGPAPRIYSMDEYFMTEVEKVEETDASKSSGSVRGKRPATKKVMEYCYEAEMEEAYRASMLRAYNKTVDEGVFTFIIVDDRNLRVADFAQFWAIGKKCGYEVYILEAAYKDPEGCAARNVHGFTLNDIQEMAGKWEEAPALYLQLDVKSLFHGDDLKENGIQEVDMDMEDENDEDLCAIEGKMPEKSKGPRRDDDAQSDHPKNGKKWDAQKDHPEEVRELGRSKWSEDPDDHDHNGVTDIKGGSSALSSLGQAYGSKKRKSFRWGDKVGDTGFSIIAAKKSNASSLVIGPGSGYNLKSNPLANELSLTSTHSPIEPKRHGVFEERLKAERESFKAVFDRRRHRIGGLQQDEE